MSLADALNTTNRHRTLHKAKPQTVTTGNYRLQTTYRLQTAHALQSFLL